MAIFARHAYAGGADVTAVLFLRFLIAGVAMACVMAASRRRWPRGRNLAVLVGMGGIGYVAQSYCFFAALNYASAGLVALLLYLHPFMVTLIGSALFGHRLGALRVGAVLRPARNGADHRRRCQRAAAGHPAGVCRSGALLDLYSGRQPGARAGGSLAAATIVMLAAGASSAPSC